MEQTNEPKTVAKPEPVQEPAKPKKALFKAMLEAQKKIENATKDATNPHHNKTYASLAAVMGVIKGPANEAGLLITQRVVEENGHTFLQTDIIHVESGETHTSRLRMHVEKLHMQGLGS